MIKDQYATSTPTLVEKVLSSPFGLTWRILEFRGFLKQGIQAVRQGDYQILIPTPENIFDLLVPIRGVDTQGGIFNRDSARQVERRAYRASVLEAAIISMTPEIDEEQGAKQLASILHLRVAVLMGSLEGQLDASRLDPYIQLNPKNKYFYLFPPEFYGRWKQEYTRNYGDKI